MNFARMVPMSLVLVVGLGGCASTKVAQMKTIETGGQKFELGGTYTPAANELVLTINGDPVMRGSFPPYTPTLRLNATYKNQQFAASCYFGSILGGGFGKRGIIAGSIQGGLGKSGDKCDITVSNASEALFF
jgi:hypothetical protein